MIQGFLKTHRMFRLCLERTERDVQVGSEDPESVQRVPRQHVLPWRDVRGEHSRGAYPHEWWVILGGPLPSHWLPAVEQERALATNTLLLKLHWQDTGQYSHKKFMCSVILYNDGYFASV